MIYSQTNGTENKGGKFKNAEVFVFLSQQSYKMLNDCSNVNSKLKTAAIFKPVIN